MSHRKSQKSLGNKTVISDGTVLFSRAPKRLEDVPLEYQASLYAKKERERIVKNDAKKKKKLDDLKTQLKTLKEKLRNATVTAIRAELEKEIVTLQKDIKKVPRPRRKWSPVLPGSFESKR